MLEKASAAVRQRIGAGVAFISRRIQAVRAATVVVRHWAVQRVHIIAHLAYFCAVAVEGHGFYAMMGGSLAIFTFFALFAGGEEA